MAEFDDAALGRMVRQALIAEIDRDGAGSGLIVTLRDHRRTITLMNIWGEQAGAFRSNLTITGE